MLGILYNLKNKKPVGSTLLVGWETGGGYIESIIS